MKTCKREPEVNYAHTVPLQITMKNMTGYSKFTLTEVILLLSLF